MAYLASLLPIPTVDAVKAECDAFDKDPATQMAEDALRQLRECFPTNANQPQVIVKVLALNRLYSARVLDKDIGTLATGIVERRIDDLLQEGSPLAVEAIIQCCSKRRYYSFATKFCSWHNPTAYVIYDGNVDECLWRYKQRDNFAGFRRGELREYEKLLSVIKAFRGRWELQRFTLREIDKFLWTIGDRLVRAKKSQK